MADWIFAISLGIIAITSIIHLIGMRGNSKRLNRNMECLERYIALLEKQSDNEVDNTYVE